MSDGVVRWLAPVAVVIGLAVVGVFLWSGLQRDPHLLPSPLIKQPTPTFNLTRLHNPRKFMSQKIFLGHVTLFNVFASWCYACADEQDELMYISRHSHVRIYGLDYKDNRGEAKKWLHRFGNPYRAIAFDATGRVAIDWGVYGTPETFIIDKHGIIRYKQVGAIDAQVWRQILEPLIQRLRVTG